MTKQSFDEMMNVLDEVVMEGSADQIDVDDGQMYSPVEVFKQVEPALVPSSPPGADFQPLLPSSPSEVLCGRKVGAISGTAIFNCSAVYAANSTV